MISLHQVDDAIIHSLHLSIHRVLGGEGSLVLKKLARKMAEMDFSDG